MEDWGNGFNRISYPSYNPTINVPKIDMIKIITIKTTSSIPSMILSNMVSSVISNPDVLGSCFSGVKKIAV
jgi:hypothetical protein